MHYIFELKFKMLTNFLTKKLPAVCCVFSGMFNNFFKFNASFTVSCVTQQKFYLKFICS